MGWKIGREEGEYLCDAGRGSGDGIGDWRYPHATCTKLQTWEVESQKGIAQKSLKFDGILITDHEDTSWEQVDRLGNHSLTTSYSANVADLACKSNIMHPLCQNELPIAHKK